MSETGEAPAPVDRPLPRETGDGTPESTQALAADSFNARSAMEKSGQTESPRAQRTDARNPKGAARGASGEEARSPEDRGTPREKGSKQEGKSDGHRPERHKLKYDPEKEKKLARKKMMNPHYFLPTDFRKYLDIPAGQGPKQAVESPLARARRRLDEVNTWRKKTQEQNPLVYNRKVGKRRG